MFSAEGWVTPLRSSRRQLRPVKTTSARVWKRTPSGDVRTSSAGSRGTNTQHSISSFFFKPLAAQMKHVTTCTRHFLNDATFESWPERFYVYSHFTGFVFFVGIYLMYLLFIFYSLPLYIHTISTLFNVALFSKERRVKCSYAINKCASPPALSSHISLLCRWWAQCSRCAGVWVWSSFLPPWGSKRVLKASLYLTRHTMTARRKQEEKESLPDDE